MYVNLELSWTEDKPANLWGYLAHATCREAGLSVEPCFENATWHDLVDVVARACDLRGKRYAAFLIDEFHVLFDRSSRPHDVLAVLREFHNRSANRIALLLADRYTKKELETKCQSDFWLQIRVLPVGPLDRVSMEEAIRASIQEQAADIRFLPETIDRIYELTNGYPFHFVTLAQTVSEELYNSGPWVTALPEDVDQAILRIIAQDRLFQDGLCRPDRIDAQLAEAIAALLEWRDLLTLLPQLSRNPDWEITLREWRPRASEVVGHLGGTGAILERLVSIGVMRKAGHDYDFFSPLLEIWLRKMRDEGRKLGADPVERPGVFFTDQESASLTGREWQRLDSKLIRQCLDAKAALPLQDQVRSPDLWDRLARPVETVDAFQDFADATYAVIVERRGELRSIVRFPSLFLAFQRIRCARHRLRHPEGVLTPDVQVVWDQMVARALGRRQPGYLPKTVEEVRSLRALMLRCLHAGLISAIEVVGAPN